MKQTKELKNYRFFVRFTLNNKKQVKILISGDSEETFLGTVNIINGKGTTTVMIEPHNSIFRERMRIKSGCLVPATQKGYGLNRLNDAIYLWFCENSLHPKEFFADIRPGYERFFTNHFIKIIGL